MGLGRWGRGMYSRHLAAATQGRPGTAGTLLYMYNRYNRCIRYSGFNRELAHATQAIIVKAGTTSKAGTLGTAGEASTAVKLGTAGIAVSAGTAGIFKAGA